MPGGIYVALSGLRNRAEQLDQVAGDIANSQTAGYKSVRSASVASERTTFAASLQSAIDVAKGGSRIDFSAGTAAPTGRGLDFAIDGPGFFAVDTPDGVRFTRDGHFQRGPDGTLQTADGLAVQAASAGGEFESLMLGPGEVSVDSRGTVLVNGAPSGTLRIVDFSDYAALTRDTSSRFKAGEGAGLVESSPAVVKSGALEQSNVSLAERLVQVTEISRTFEALQRGVSVLMNDVDGRAITELGRR